MIEQATAKKGMSTGAKWGLGCGVGCLTILLIGLVAAFLGYRCLRGKVRAATAEMRQFGFERVVTRQMVEVTTEITEPTLYVGQLVKIQANCRTNLAIVAQAAEIHGRVDGKVYFRGQMLTIQPQAEVMGGLDAVAQVVHKLGKVAGPITGKGPTPVNVER